MRDGWARRKAVDSTDGAFLPALCSEPLSAKGGGGGEEASGRSALRVLKTAGRVDLNAMAAPVANRNLKSIVVEEEEEEEEVAEQDENRRRNMGQVSECVRVRERESLPPSLTLLWEWKRRETATAPSV